MLSWLFDTKIRYKLRFILVFVISVGILFIWNIEKLTNQIYQTKDLLLALPLPTSSGFASVLQNVGSVKNSGIELLVGVGIINQQDLSWDTSFNITTSNNEVVNLGELQEISIGNIEAIGNTAVLKPGWAIGEYYGYKMNGLLQNDSEVAASATPNSRPGAPKWIDQNGDGTINIQDIIILVNIILGND